ncbi:hypothetical protein GJ744_000160 [Endocarpon pusillum]|uniref:Phytanoyl-CoA dioxygenase family protein n=1 Tax=Endocarpon pusillum TaxID=364733 RepID=A0A8H7EAA7_9EURO|nr:hypothetical protein GJ744_000160 [Endocarpon pusillum]
MASASSTVTTTSTPQSQTQSQPPPVPTILASCHSSNTSTPIPTPTASKPACATCPTHLLKSLKRDGYIHIPALLDPVQIFSLRKAASQVVNLARSGKWPYIRTVPKQFPPWSSTPPPDSEGGIWGIQHLLHPEMPGRKEFAKLYFGNAIIGVVKELLGLNLYDPRSEDKIVMELLNLLISPSGNKDFELRWHRDDIRWETDAEEEKRQLDEKSPGGRQAHAQYNIALYDDESLIVVPESHRRVRTEEERNADPYAPELKDMKVVKMKAGDAVFYDSNIVHRGVYKGVDLEKGEVGRMTLHGSVGLYDHSEERAKNVLQHGLRDWVDREDAPFNELQGKCRARAEGMRMRLVEMGNVEDLGYSLEG